MLPPGAVLDANALFPIALCDTLLRAAVERLYRPFWSVEILDEMERNLVQQQRATTEAARRRRQRMQDAFPLAMVTGYADLIPGLRNDPKDRHVLAVALHANVQIIVTQNLRHFPIAVLDPFDIEAMSADTFLLSLFDRDSKTLTRIIHEQAADLTRPPQSVEQVLARLQVHVPEFVGAVRRSAASP